MRSCGTNTLSRVSLTKITMDVKTQFRGYSDEELVVLLILVGSNVLGQTRVMGPGPGQHRFLTADQVSRVPFQADLDRVVFTATINGKAKVRLVLDTGMPMPGLMLVGKEKKDQWGLNFVAEMPIAAGSPSKEPLVSGVAQGVKLDLSGLELTDLAAIVEPANGSLSSVLKGVDGIIGAELFGQLVVTIDYDHQEIVLEEPATFRAPAGAEELPLTIKNGFPWLACSAEMASGATVPMDLVVDLGAAHALSLNANANAKIVPPDNAVETLLGRTVSGPIYGRVGRIKGLHLGAQTLKDVVTSFQTGERRGPSAMEKEGNLGNGVLRRFKVSFDYKKGRLVLAPNSHFNDPFEYNMSGIEYSTAPDGNLKVERILPGSPAAQSELKPGDTISEIAGRPVTGIGEDELKRMLRTDGSTIILLASSSGNVAKKITLTLRRII